MSELSAGSSESDPLGSSLSVWLADGGDALFGPDDLNVPLDLHTACSIGQHDVVSECILREEVDGKNAGGWTPLMYAAYIGHEGIVKLLMEAGVSVNARTCRALSPLMLAASCGNDHIASLLLQRGAKLESTDARGWTALMHSTANGHKQMVKLLLAHHANANVREPLSGMTPLMEAAASGHEIITQYLLNQGVRTEERNSVGETARSLSVMYGHNKITSLIDLHLMRVKTSLCEEWSSSEEEGASPRVRSSRLRPKAPSIHDGPQAVARFRVGTKHEDQHNQGVSNREVTSPISEQDGQSTSGREELFPADAPTLRSSSSSSSSEGLSQVLGISRDASLESNEDSDPAKRSCPRRPSKHSRGGATHTPSYAGPQDLAEFLEQIGFSKYRPLLEEQDIDLRIFLTLTENDLKEVGVTLFGPKRKMTSAIARWHSNARPASDALEQAYADQLEAEMQEMAIQLHKRCAELEALQAQVSQEKELRGVMEACLMEEKAGWRKMEAGLRESRGRVQGLDGTLSALRHSHARLRRVVCDDPRASGEGSVCSQLLSVMESHMDELAGGVNEVLHGLQRLSASDNNSQKWEES